MPCGSAGQGHPNVGTSPIVGNSAPIEGEKGCMQSGIQFSYPGRDKEREREKVEGRGKQRGVEKKEETCRSKWKGDKSVGTSHQDIECTQVS